ncbi:hypothetical protein [Hymenobacter nivis]|uniref:Glucosidase n=1 Tax=Hymenobacter nivis TaxID=1850093 RepID=A0A2Z3GHZ5_9BACT|nr:hypothetical protein [Hymenobacter nivis]AWM31462.1 hypothetical protein DDQ68_00860 [Hymenobacter nivis]
MAYVAGESDSDMFGGNSNWRGPICLPVNYLIIKLLQRLNFHDGYSFTIEYPTGSGHELNLHQVAAALAKRLAGLLLRGPDGRRPAFAQSELLQTDPHFKDYLLFPEYFDGDYGKGLGVSHQTGWTGLIGRLLQ